MTKFFKALYHLIVGEDESGAVNQNFECAGFGSRIFVHNLGSQFIFMIGSVACHLLGDTR
jgi:hypothetical protein